MTTGEETTATQVPTKAFISYAWSGPTHESWVVSLATRLREDGIDVILDKWDLKPGHDAHHFMEQMVRDPTVTKVVMVCDKNYVEKADGRSGGVGIESQIISPEIYASAAQDKYAAAITELDEEGKPFVPIFYKGRIYFDFAASEHFEREYESLLRWILNKPLHVKPKLGTVPAHVAGVVPVAAATLSASRRAEEAVRNQLPSARAFTRDFVEKFVEQVADAGSIAPVDGDWYEQVLASLNRMRPYLHQFQDLTRTVARFSGDPDVFEELVSGVESAGKLMYRPPDVMSWSDHSFDHYRLALWELFLTVFAILLRERRYDLAQSLVSKAYLIPNRDGGDKATTTYTDFFHPIPTLRTRAGRLGTSASQADVLQETYKSGAITFGDLMQADLVLYLRSVIVSHQWARWFPVTLAFADQHRPFEIFARSESKAFFSRVAPLLGVKNEDEFKALMHKVIKAKELSFGGWPLGVERLVNLDNVASVP